MQNKLRFDIVGNIIVCVTRSVHGINDRPLFVYRNEKIIHGLRIARNQTRVSGEAAVIENCVNVEYCRDLSDSSIVQKGR